MNIKKKRGQPKIDAVANDQVPNLLEAAVVDAFRWKLYIDGMLLKKKDGKLDAWDIASILSGYGIARNFQKGVDSQKIANIVNLVELTNDLKKSSSACMILAKKFKEKNLTANNNNKSIPLSAASKFLWFRFPNRWTMYDKYASAALVPKTTFKGIEKFNAYYNQLCLRKFTKVCEKIESIDTPKCVDIPASKIIDKYLFLVGQDDKARCRSMKFLSCWKDNTLPERCQSNLDKLICELKTVYEKAPLLHSDS